MLCLLLAQLVSRPSPAWAESFTTNVLDGVATNVDGPFILGDSGPSNFLLLTNGGALTNTTGIIGHQAGAHANLAMVTGPGTVWQNTSNFILGATGAVNTLLLSDGGRLGPGPYVLSIGLDPASSNNVLQASGANTFLDISWFNLGDGGSGNRIVVAEGAQAGRGISQDVVNNIGVQPGSSDNLLLVEGPGSSWITDGFRVGLAGPRNRLIVRNGARLTNGFLTVGREVSSVQNSVLVRGAGSFLDLRGSVSYLGFDGAENTVTVDEGAWLNSPQFVIGLSNNATGNRAALAGASSLWTQTGPLTVGRWGGNNSMSVSDGAALQAASLMVGERSPGNRFEVTAGGRLISSTSGRALVIGDSPGADRNVVIFEGTGTLGTNLGYAFVGYGGSHNQLIVQGGAKFHQRLLGVQTFYIGLSNTSRSNLLFVTGPDSRLSGSPSVMVGGNGSGNVLTIADGARVDSSATTLGSGCLASDNVALVTGAGTVWSNGLLEVGYCSTNNHLVISNGAVVLAGLVRSGVQGGFGNSVTVADRGSLLRASGNFVLGNAGTSNRLVIADGGRLEGRVDTIGFGGSAATALITGTGSTWTNLELTVGNLTGLNNLRASDGAQLRSGRTVLGVSPKSTANGIEVTGAGTTWAIATNLAIGGNGSSNEFAVIQGARVTARDIQLAAAELAGTAIGTSSANLLTISGSNTVVSIASNVWVGYRGSANRMEIRDGGTLESSAAILSVQSGSSSNSVLVSGPGAQWLNVGNLVIGGSGTRNELAVERGGRVVSGPAVLGAGGIVVGQGSFCPYRFSGARARVTGPGSVWDCRGALLMGEYGIGNWLAISNGGCVMADNLHLGMTDGGSADPRCPPFSSLNRLEVEGGCLVVTNASGTARLKVRFGTLSLRTGLVAADFLEATNSEPGRLELFGGTLRLRHAQWESTTPVEVGDGLHTARLEIPNGSAFFAGSLTIRPHGILSGHAAIQTTVANHGIIEPGNRDNGLMSFNGSFVQGPWGVLAFSIGGPANLGDYTKMSVTPTASFDGSLRVALRNGFVPTSSDWYLVVTCPAASGAFTNAPDRGRLLTSDRLGSFLVLYTNNAVVLTDYQSTDLDSDGLEDAWATNYFGHTPMTPAERAADDDGDGASNGDEFHAGTNPRDSASVLRASLVYTHGAATLSFPCVEGRVYRVLVSADLTGWREVPSPTFAWPAPGRCAWTDDGQDTRGRGADWRFYRLEVE